MVVSVEQRYLSVPRGTFTSTPGVRVILRLVLPLLLYAAGSAVAQVSTSDSLPRRDSAVPPQSRTAHRAPDPQLGEKLGRIDADIRDAKTPEERTRLQAERARLLEQSTGEEVSIQTGPMSGGDAQGTAALPRTSDDYSGLENANTELEVVSVDNPPSTLSDTRSTRYTALPSRTARVRPPVPSTAHSAARPAAAPRRQAPVPALRSAPSRSAPRIVDRPEPRENGGAVDRASAMARRGQRTEARRTLIDYLRRNPRSPQAVEARKLLQTL